MSSTTIDIDTNSCQQIGQDLAQVLSNTYILYIKTQNFHWNIVDPRFFFLHEMFEEQYKELAENIDELAERMRKLKLKALGSMREFLQAGSIEEAEGDLTGDEMIEQLLEGREAIIRSLRPKIEQASELGDEGTADLFIQTLRQHEKAAWMLRSHLMEES